MDGPTTSASNSLPRPVPSVRCGEAVTRQVDDVGFVGSVIEDVAARHSLARARVYATGMSNGAMMAGAAIGR